jgi:Carboxypeptidase regulatory-like domain
LWRTMASLTIGVSMRLFLFSFSGIAQTTFGSITGPITDPGGAVVPGAAVTVTNEGTGMVRRATTRSTGDFNAPLGVGSYRIGVRAKGFEIYDQTGLHLSAHQTINLNFGLVLGTTATVTQVVVKQRPGSLNGFSRMCVEGGFK